MLFAKYHTIKCSKYRILGQNHRTKNLYYGDDLISTTVCN